MFPGELCREECLQLMQAMRDDLHTRWQEVVDTAERLVAENKQRRRSPCRRSCFAVHRRTMSGEARVGTR